MSLHIDSTPHDEAISATWLPAETPLNAMHCPACGSARPKQAVLDCHYTPPGYAPKTTRLLACADCHVLFYDDQNPPSYDAERVMSWGWHQFHIQQGAGIWSIITPMGRIAKPAGARFLEVGCGYGFGIDFVARLRGWDARGIDPSPLAELGGRELGIPVRHDYFTEADLNGEPFDIVAATEVIEHVPSPRDFLWLLCRALKPNGILLMTTPDGDCITRATPNAILVPLLVPGAHLVFQTEISLRAMLNEFGFGHIVIERDSGSLIIYASRVAFTLIDDEPALRRDYRSYLQSRSHSVPAASDLQFGLAGRSLFEATNDGDFAVAAEGFSIVTQAAQSRFGLDLTNLTSLPPDAMTMTLAALKDTMPLNLGTILFGHAMALLATGTPRATLAPLFELAAHAADALSGALGRLALADALTEEIAWTARAEYALCLAEMASPSCIAALISLPVRDGSGARRREMAWRGLIALVNEGANDLARTLILHEKLIDPAADLPNSLARNATIILGQLALGAGGNPAEALIHAASLDAANPDNTEIIVGFRLGAFSRLVNQGDYAAAKSVAQVHDIASLALHHPGQDATDARRSLAVLELADGDPARVPSLIAELDLNEADRRKMLLGSFTRLVNASRFAEAQALGDSEAIEALINAHSDAVAADAALAFAVLDLSIGDPARVPARLAGPHIDPDRRTILILDAFTRLVTQARYVEAQHFARAHDIDNMARANPQAGIDALLSLVVLDLTAGDPAMVSAHLAGLDVPPAQQDEFLIDAFARLVDAGRLDDASALSVNEDIPSRVNRSQGKTNADGLIALALLDLAKGDPAAVFTRLAAGKLSQTQSDPLKLSAFVQLVNQARYDEAALIATREAIENCAVHFDNEAGDDARLALCLLDLAKGDPALVPARVRILRAAGRIQQDRLDALMLDAFARLINEARYDDAALVRMSDDIETIAARHSGPAAADARIGLCVLDLKIGDPAGIAARLSALRAASIGAARLDPLTLGAFTKLVNQSRYAEALAWRDAEHIATLSRTTQDVESARAASLSLAVLDLAAGDPADVPGRLAGIAHIPQSEATALILSAFTTLVGQSRIAQARGFEAAHHITSLADIDQGQAGDDAVLALCTLDLASGNAIAVPARLANRPRIEPASADKLLIAAFASLVSAGDYEQARSLALTSSIAERARSIGGQAGHDAAIALAMLDLNAGDPALVPTHLQLVPGLDPAQASALILGGFSRLVNAGRTHEAAEYRDQHNIPQRAVADTSMTGTDALTCLYLLALQPGGDAASLIGAFEQIAARQTDPAQAQTLGLTGFVTLVNQGAFEAARILLDELRLPASADFDLSEPNWRDGLFALGMLSLHEPESKLQAVAAFSRLRGWYRTNLAESEPAPGLFWSCLRGEVVALDALGRAAEATSLIKIYTKRHPGAPDDLLKRAGGRKK